MKQINIDVIEALRKTTNNATTYGTLTVLQRVLELSQEVAEECDVRSDERYLKAIDHAITTQSNPL